MACLFLILTIINIPVYMFYYSSNPNYAILSPADFFTSMSLGNLGEEQKACDVINWSVAKEVTLSCSQGILTDLKYAGISKNDRVSCLGMRSTKNPQDLMLDGCYYDYEDDSAGGW